MAIEKLTLFELHFDGAQFGPRFLGTDEADAEDETTDGSVGVEADSPDGVEESDGGPRFLALFATSTLLAIGATLLARKLFGGDEQTTVDDFAEESVESESIESESIGVEGDDAAA